MLFRSAETGETARLLAKFHPTSTVIAVCEDARVARQIEGYMQNCYSVVTEITRGNGAHVRVGFSQGKKKGLFVDGDLVVCVHTMRNLENTKEWTVRILNVTDTSA